MKQNVQFENIRVIGHDRDSIINFDKIIFLNYTKNKKNGMKIGILGNEKTIIDREIIYNENILKQLKRNQYYIDIPNVSEEGVNTLYDIRSFAILEPSEFKIDDEVLDISGYRKIESALINYLREKNLKKIANF